MKAIAAVGLLLAIASPAVGQSWKDWHNANPTYPGGVAPVQPAPVVSPSATSVDCVPKISVGRIQFEKVKGKIIDTNRTYAGRYDQNSNTTYWKQTKVSHTFEKNYQPVFSVTNISQCQVRGFQVKFDAFEGDVLRQRASIIRNVDLAPGQKIEVTGDRFRPKAGLYRTAPIPKGLEILAY